LANGVSAANHLGDSKQPTQSAVENVTEKLTNTKLNRKLISMNNPENNQSIA